MKHQLRIPSDTFLKTHPGALAFYAAIVASSYHPLLAGDDSTKPRTDLLLKQDPKKKWPLSPRLFDYYAGDDLEPSLDHFAPCVSTPSDVYAPVVNILQKYNEKLLKRYYDNLIVADPQIIDKTKALANDTENHNMLVRVDLTKHHVKRIKKPNAIKGYELCFEGDPFEAQVAEILSENTRKRIKGRIHELCQNPQTSGIATIDLESFSKLDGRLLQTWTRDEITIPLSSLSTTIVIQKENFWSKPKVPSEKDEKYLLERTYRFFDQMQKAYRDIKALADKERLDKVTPHQKKLLKTKFADFQSEDFAVACTIVTFGLFYLNENGSSTLSNSKFFKITHTLTKDIPEVRQWYDYIKINANSGGPQPYIVNKIPGDAPDLDEYLSRYNSLCPVVPSEVEYSQELLPETWDPELLTKIREANAHNASVKTIDPPDLDIGY